MTTKKPTKAVAEKATNVVNKATTKKPTIKQLQEELNFSLETIKVLETETQANFNLAEALGKDLNESRSTIQNLEKELLQQKAAVFNRDKIIEELSKPWWKKVLGLFGN